tara:strand:+ start:1676 stop:2020 length:345 start_codon:yes stop_codon:yes gene_type:complete
MTSHSEINWTEIHTTDVGGTYTLEDRLTNVLLCAAADAQRGIATERYAVERGLKYVLERTPTATEINIALSKLPGNWHSMLVVGFYMNATNTLVNKLDAMNYLKAAINEARISG